MQCLREIEQNNLMHLLLVSAKRNKTELNKTYTQNEDLHELFPLALEEATPA